MMKYLLLLFSLYSVNVYAELACGEEANRAVVSLKTPEHPNSLQNMRVQDQDGLGTCYANTLALMLEGTLEGRPQLSYQQIAVINGLAAQSRASRTGLNRMSAFKANGESIITESGNACVAFEHVRAAGSQLCRRSDVPIEDQIHGWDQKWLFKSISTLYDEVTDSLEGMSTDTAKKNWLDGFTLNLRRAARIADARSLLRCNNLRDPPVEAITEVVTDYCQDLADQLTQYELQLSTIGNKGAGGEEDPQRERRIERLTERREEAIQNLSKYGYEFDGFDYSCNLKPEITNAMRGTYWNHLSGTQGANPRAAVNVFLAEARIGNEAFVNDEGELDPRHLSSILRRDTEVANPETCRRALQWKDLRTASFLDSHLGNQYSCFSDTISNSMGLLSKSNARGIPLTSSINALMAFDQPLNQFMMGVVGPGCMENAIEIPDTLSCNPVNYPRIPNRLGAAVRSDPASWTREPNKSAILEASRNRVRTEVEAALDNNRPLGFLTCTSYIKDNNDDTNDSNYSRNCNATGSHAMHLMNIVGHRCVDGVLQYQIQNSWGSGCNWVVDASADEPESQYDCDDGAFWVPEDTVSRNIRQTYSLTGSAASSSSP